MKGCPLLIKIILSQMKSITNKKKLLKPEYFKDLNFPEVTKEISPIEIEIGKSGKIYTYD